MKSRRTEKKNRRRNKTLRGGLKKKHSARIISNTKIIQNFIQMLNTVKLYHWKTRSYAQHKATDELYERLNDNIDKFVEILLGKDESRIKMTEKNIQLIDASNTSDIKAQLYAYREFLINLSETFSAKRDTDLLNVRDELLGDINQFLYLLTLDK